MEWYFCWFSFDFEFVHHVTRLILYLNRHAILQQCPISYDHQYKEKNFMIYIILAIKFQPLQTLFPHNRIELKKVELLGGELKYFFNSGIDYVKIQLYITFNSPFSVYNNIIRHDTSHSSLPIGTLSVSLRNPLSLILRCHHFSCKSAVI